MITSAQEVRSELDQLEDLMDATADPAAYEKTRAGLPVQLAAMVVPHCPALDLNH